MPLRLFSVLFALTGLLHAHVVPSLTIETRFKNAGTFDLTINFDPRAFLAADPRSLPPVSGAWLADQAPQQAAATLEQARDYLRQSVHLLFNGRPIPLPELAVQPIDGADNTPLKADTQELHLLATGTAAVPAGATEFQITLPKTAAIDLILLNTLEGTTERRPQVLFPGETSRPLLFQPAAPPPAVPNAEAGLSQFAIIIVLILAAAAVTTGWAFLRKYRHFHRGHRKPKDRHSS